MTIKLKRVTVKPERNGVEGYTYYETRDGRFRISPFYSLGGGGWQVAAQDGSEPFRTRFAGRTFYSKWHNADTLRECREELEAVYEAASEGGVDE